MEQQGRVLYIEATFELRDYFHAYFDAAKTKLIIAWVIVALVMAAFTYFFFLIGELYILLQLSPFFFGLPLVAIAGQFLRIHAAYRKQFADFSESEKNVLYIFQENSDGFDIVRGKNFGHLSWESVREVVERSRYFRFVLGKYDTLILPKRFLRHHSDALLLREIIVSHLGIKAKLLRE